MKPNISECQTFMTYDSMKFMAFEANGYGCGGCHFTQDDSIIDNDMVGAFVCILFTIVPPIPLSERGCSISNRNDNRNIIWIRVE